LSLDSQTVRNISYLARLRLPEDQIDTIAHELSAILGWIEQLAEIDTEGVAPMTGVAMLVLPMRPDRVTDGGDPAAVLANAPGGIEDCFAVPKVVE
jgi:aspartyl-tRNA(Asn)/glutamyl-tRNA(Gln) amidotransferase subunit C